MKRLIPFLVAAGYASVAWSQTATQPGTIVGTLDAQGYMNDTVIYTVPAGKNARITDLHITNFSDANMMTFVSFGGAPRWYYVAARATLIVPVNSGFGLVPGQTVVGSSDYDKGYLQMRGFYFTIP